MNGWRFAAGRSAIAKRCWIFILAAMILRSRLLLVLSSLALVTGCRLLPWWTQEDLPARAAVAPGVDPVESGRGANAGVASTALTENPAQAAGEVSAEPPAGRAAEPSSGIDEAPLAASAWAPVFEAEKPVRLAMPVPVFAPPVNLDAVVPGWVEFMVRIDELGNVIEAEITGASHPELREPALRSIKQARYSVARSPAGLPLRVSFTDRVRF